MLLVKAFRAASFASRLLLFCAQIVFSIRRSAWSLRKIYWTGRSPSVMNALQSWRQSLFGQSRPLHSVPKLSERGYAKVHKPERYSESDEETLQPFLQAQKRATTDRPNWCIIFFFLLFNAAALVTIYFGLLDISTAPLPGRGFFPPGQSSMLESP